MAALRKGWYCKDITIIIYQPIVILFLISNGNIYTHKKFQIVVTAKIYTLEIPFCGCINQCVQNLVPARICTFESTLRADHSLQLSPCYFFFFLNYLCYYYINIASCSKVYFLSFSYIPVVSINLPDHFLRVGR